MARYTSQAEAKTITGVDLSMELLIQANATINNYTEYRWVATDVADQDITVVQRNLAHLFEPVISVVSISDPDGNVLVLDTDYSIRKSCGEVRLAGYYEYITASYQYGFTSNHYSYANDINVVKGVEARIALYYKRNPAMLPSLQLGNARLNFAGVTNNDHIQTLLSQVPRPYKFWAV